MPQANNAAKGRRPYVTPRLKLYGSVQALTATGSSGTVEGTTVRLGRPSCRNNVSRRSCQYL